jgi:hypothetical protein
VFGHRETNPAELSFILPLAGIGKGIKKKGDI